MGTHHKEKKKTKINITPKKTSNINDWIKTDNQDFPNNQQKFTQLDTGWGNIPDSKGEQIFRILSGNIHGLSIDTPTQPKLHEILTNSTMMQADAILFQETNTDFKKIEAMNILQQTLKFYHQNHATTVSNSTVHAKNNNWLPGGTLTSVLGRWTGAKITSGNDYPLGR